MKEPKQVKVRTKPTSEVYDYTPPPRTGFMSELPESIQNYVEQKQSKIDTAKQEFYEALNEYTAPISEQGMMEVQNETKDTKTQTESKDENQEGEKKDSQGDSQDKKNQENEEEQLDLTCTKEERVFLNAFKTIQSAGRLLGMARTSGIDEDANLLNTRLFPVPNIVSKSEMLFIKEFEADKEIYNLFNEKRHELISATQTLLLKYEKEEIKQEESEGYF